MSSFHNNNTYALEVKRDGGTELAAYQFESNLFHKRFFYSSTTKSRLGEAPSRLNNRIQVYSLGVCDLSFYLNKYYCVQVKRNKKQTKEVIVNLVIPVAEKILKEIEAQEPRFISTLPKSNGLSANHEKRHITSRDDLNLPESEFIGNGETSQSTCFDYYEGISVVGRNEFQILLYLNQMGVLNFVDDFSQPGYGVLKLSDGRKRSMSLWVEFITASGYLSAKKIRCRFNSLINLAVEKLQTNLLSSEIESFMPINEVKAIGGISSDCLEVRINGIYKIKFTPSFKCNGMWPKSGMQWPYQITDCISLWPNSQVISQVKSSGFTLLSNHQVYCQIQKKQDSWLIQIPEGESILLSGGMRKKCFDILKSLRDFHLDFPENPVSYYLLKTLVLFESEKHPNEEEWQEKYLGDRINGILLQLTNCLQCKCCPHYFLPRIDLLKVKSDLSLELASKHTWHLLRELLFNPKFLESFN